MDNIRRWEQSRWGSPRGHLGPKAGPLWTNPTLGGGGGGGGGKRDGEQSRRGLPRGHFGLKGDLMDKFATLGDWEQSRWGPHMGFFGLKVGPLFTGIFNRLRDVSRHELELISHSLRLSDIRCCSILGAKCCCF